MLTVVRMCGVNNNGDIKNEFPSLLTGFLTNQKRQAGAATVTWISCETILTFTKTHGSSYIHIVNFNSRRSSVPEGTPRFDTTTVNARSNQRAAVIKKTT